MKTDLLKKISEMNKVAQTRFGALTPAERVNVERTWDLEHAYYSSALEGSNVDRGEVEELSRSVK